jgi:hypothetical protein
MKINILKKLKKQQKFYYFGIQKDYFRMPYWIARFSSCFYQNLINEILL